MFIYYLDKLHASEGIQSHGDWIMNSVGKRISTFKYWGHTHMLSFHIWFSNNVRTLECTVQCPMILPIDNEMERMWNERAWGNLRYYSSIDLEKLRKAKKTSVRIADLRA
jgi:hypothetical protein